MLKNQDGFLYKITEQRKRRKGMTKRKKLIITPKPVVNLVNFFLTFKSVGIKRKRFVTTIINK